MLQRFFWSEVAGSLGLRTTEPVHQSHTHPSFAQQCLLGCVMSKRPIQFCQSGNLLAKHSQDC